MPSKTSVEQFLSAESEQDLIEAICVAETETSGEIRVHIEATTKLPILDRAIALFNELEMDKTQARNGVIIYVAVDDKKFAIYGDEGINKLVDDHFWDTTKTLIESYFKQGQFKTGLQLGILNIGAQLKLLFPVKDNDNNELPNTISKG